MKLGVVVGHTNNNRGAFSATLNDSEYIWNKDLAERIEPLVTSFTVQTFFRDGVGISGAYAQADAFGADITVELHFNASHNHHATGTGVLYYPGSTKGKVWATHLRREIGAAMSLPDWPSGTGGVVTPFQASGQQRRGQGSLSAGRAPAALIEPFFGSNPQDCALAASQKDGLALAIVRAAEAYFGL